MAETGRRSPGTQVQVQVRYAGAIVLEETFEVCRSGDLRRADAAARAAASKRLLAVPDEELLTRFRVRRGPIAVPDATVPLAWPAFGVDEAPYREGHDA